MDRRGVRSLLWALGLGLSLFAAASPARADEAFLDWAFLYNNDDQDGADGGTGLGLDVAGNVYVTGYSFGGYAAYLDIVVFQIGPDGEEAWSARYDSGSLYQPDDRAFDLVVGEDGWVFVAGTSSADTPPQSTDLDLALLGYDTQSDDRWAVRLDGAGNGPDGARALARDAAGNLYVAGDIYTGWQTQLDLFVARYDAAGESPWDALYVVTVPRAAAAPILAVGGAPLVVAVTGSSRSVLEDDDCMTVAYDAAGNELWAARYDAGQLNDRGNAVAVDAEGNVFVAGDTAVEIGKAPVRQEALVLKYLPGGGDPDWVFRFAGPEGDAQSFGDVAVLPTGGVVAVGTVDQPPHGEDWLVVRVDANGNQDWAATYNGPGNTGDAACAVAVDAAGSVYVAGTSGEGPATQDDILVIRYDADGDEVWRARYDGPAHSRDAPYDIAVDDQGAAYVSGTVGGTDLDLAVLKFHAECGGCFIDGDCFDDGAPNPENPCQVCDAQSAADAWTDADGAPCEDGLFCNGADECLGGACDVHAGDPCGADEICNEETDACDPLPPDDDAGDDDIDDDTGDDAPHVEGVTEECSGCCC